MTSGVGVRTPGIDERAGKAAAAPGVAAGGESGGAAAVEPILTWAAVKRSPVTLSVETDGQWLNFRSQLIGYDAREKLLKVVAPRAGSRAVDDGAEESTQVEMGNRQSTASVGPIAPQILALRPGAMIGITFRRGHKKCVFVSAYVVQRAEATDGAEPIDTLILRAPATLREIQRRSYQRITLPADRFVAVRLWQDGLPGDGRPSWPLCSGRVSNVSLGGVLMDIRREHNPRLSVGENVGVEITPCPGGRPLLVEGQYRHCVILPGDRLGLGVQFLGLERDTAGRSTLDELTAFVGDVRRQSNRAD